MAKVAKPDAQNDAAGQGARLGAALPKLLQVAVTDAQLDRCRRSLYQKLARAIVNGPDDGDVGIISKAFADLRALDLIEPVRPREPEEHPEVDPPDIAERKAAASDDAAMQMYNQKIAAKEAIDAARAEA